MNIGEVSFKKGDNVGSKMSKSEVSFNKTTPKRHPGLKISTTHIFENSAWGTRWKDAARTRRLANSACPLDNTAGAAISSIVSKYDRLD